MKPKLSEKPKLSVKFADFITFIKNMYCGYSNEVSQ